MTTVDVGVAVAGLVILATVLGLGLWALRVQRRQFPKDWDRPGWEPSGRTGWLVTKFTWLSGGRG